MKTAKILIIAIVLMFLLFYYKITSLQVKNKKLQNTISYLEKENAACDSVNQINSAHIRNLYKVFKYKPVKQ
jgi:hypothetical protein